MHLLALVASVLGIEVDELLGHFKKNVMAWLAVAVFVLIGVVFLLMALNAWFTVLWGAIVAPLAIGGTALLVALSIWAALAITDAMAKRRAAQRRNSAERTALVTTAALTAVPLLLRSNLMKKLGLPVGGALAAAYLLSKSGSEGGDREDDD